jgi:crotonobetainyl-CoA:carnitine CoA-transferase CaiB-like acyl-CoA transferase
MVAAEDDRVGVVHMPRPAPRLGRTPAAVRWFERPLGADNEVVYGEWLGLTSEDLQHLHDAAVV